MSTVATNKPPSRAREWTRLIAITGSAQVAVQAIGFACGILVIRLLPVEEYAYYTLANTMLGMMTVLADGGVANGVMSQGGKVWQDRKRLGAVLATGMTLRRQFAVYSLLVSTPILLYLMHKQGASWITSTMLVLSLMPTFFSALSSKLLEISTKLHQDIAALQTIQVASNGLRLLLSALVLFIFPFAAFAILASGVSQVYGNWRLRRASQPFADQSEAEDPEVRREILQIVRRQLPSAIYFCFSSQLTLWVVSILGSTRSLAEVGALARVSTILSLVIALFGVLIIPRFSRLPQNSYVIFRWFNTLLAAGLTIAALFTLSAWALPQPYLLLLGENYANTESLLAWAFTAAGLAMVNMIASQLMGSRGIILPPLVYIPYSLTVRILAFSSQDLTNLQGVFSAAILSSLGDLAFRYTTFLVLAPKTLNSLRSPHE